MKTSQRLLISFSVVALLAGWTFSSSAATITPGQLVNIRVGDGTTTAAATGLPVTLDVYNVTYTGIVPTGVTLAQSIPAPTATTGTAPTSGNRYLVQGGTAGGEGGLLVSGDGAYMTFAGYNRLVGQTLNGGASDLHERVVGFLDLAAGTIDTTTTFAGWTGSGGGGTAARGAYALNGTQVWLAASTGVRYGTAFATNTGTGVAIDGTNNARRVQVYDGQLYQSEAANNRSGIEKVGTGTPTTAASATMALLPGFSTTNATYSAYDFWFADDNTLYIADDTSTNNRGLQKWTFNGTTWTMQFNYKLSGAGLPQGIKGLTGYLDPSGNAIMFATTVGANGNFMVSLVDPVGNTVTTGVTETTLVSASSFFGGGANWNLRGLAMQAPPLPPEVPEPATLGLLALASLALLPRRSRRA